MDGTHLTDTAEKFVCQHESIWELLSLRAGEASAEFHLQPLCQMPAAAGAENVKATGAQTEKKNVHYISKHVEG